MNKADVCVVTDVLLVELDCILPHSVFQSSRVGGGVRLHFIPFSTSVQPRPLLHQHFNCICMQQVLDKAGFLISKACLLLCARSTLPLICANIMQQRIIFGWW